METTIAFIFTWMIPLAIIGLGFYLSVRTDILRDQCENCTRKPFSFSKAQLMWWTLIILSCFSVAYGVNPHMIPEPNQSMLVLLGISLGTTVVGKVIDTSEINNPKIQRFQETDKKGKGFITNLLSDGNGISVSRFQAFFFNIIYGVIFIYFTSSLYSL